MSLPITATTLIQPKPIPKVSSLVFFDLETTGLSNPKITEISLCAVERDHFLSSKEPIPRVNNRLNLCIYPTRLIDLKAAEMTQLDNYVLQNQSPFNIDVFNLISSFLNRLPTPVCLIAHNGNRFDFPILKAEIEKLGKKLAEDLLCADSLSVFKALHELEEVERVLSSSDLTLSPTSTISDSTSLSTSDTSVEENKTPLQNLLTILEKNYQNGSRGANNTSEVLSSSDLTSSNSTPSTSDTSKEGNKTPLLSTPIKLLTLITPEKTPSCVKKLPFCTSSPSPPKKKRFDLISIYERLHCKTPIQSHAAESDVLTLLSSAMKIAPEFLDAVEQMTATFDSVKKSW